MDDFQKQLNEAILHTIPDAIAKGMEKACLLVEAEAKKKAPIDDGLLRASITHDVEKEKEITGVIGSNLEYAPYVHQGTCIYAKEGNGRQSPWKFEMEDGTWITTEGQKPNPFIQDAIDAKQSEILTCFADLI